MDDSGSGRFTVEVSATARICFRHYPTHAHDLYSWTIVRLWAGSTVNRNQSRRHGPPNHNQHQDTKAKEPKDNVEVGVEGLDFRLHNSLRGVRYLMSQGLRSFSLLKTFSSISSYRTKQFPQNYSNS